MKIHKHSSDECTIIEWSQKGNGLYIYFEWTEDECVRVCHRNWPLVSENVGQKLQLTMAAAASKSMARLRTKRTHCPLNTQTLNRRQYREHHHRASTRLRSIAVGEYGVAI